MVVKDILLPCMAERTFPRLWFGFVKAYVCMSVFASACFCICMRVCKLYVCRYVSMFVSASIVRPSNCVSFLQSVTVLQAVWRDV